MIHKTEISRDSVQIRLRCGGYFSFSLWFRRYRDREIDMGIFSKSVVNLLSSSAKSRSISKFASLSSNLFCDKLRTHAPMFVKQHNKLNLLVRHTHKRSLNMSLVSTGDNSSNTYLISPEHNHYNSFFYPAASCNGLLLSYIDIFFRGALWNPTTDEIKALPESSVPRSPSVTCEYICFYGFGFDPASQDYKVIRFLQFDYEDGNESPGFDFQVELYSLKTDSWKGIAYPYKNVTNLIEKTCVYVNGFYYWAAFYGKAAVVLPFDFSNEKFSSTCIPLPETDKLRDKPRNFLLVEFEGSLAALVYALAGELGADEKPFEFEIWVWNSEEESWTKVSAMDVPGVSVAFPLGLLRNDELYLQNHMGEMVLFDCAKGKLKNIGLKGDGMKMLPYVESTELMGTTQPAGR